jgi:glycosyltransferase involved in cell wall biosynthesis
VIEDVGGGQGNRHSYERTLSVPSAGRVGVPEVSVCVRASQARESLRAAIQSVLDQTYENFEIVVSDDSGLLEDITARFGDGRIFYHPNSAPAGPAANLKTVMGLARGRLLAVLNDDDVWLPTFLETVTQRFEADPELGVVFTDVLLAAGERRVALELPLTPGRHDHFVAEVLNYGVPASSGVISRAAWEQGEARIPLSAQMVGDSLLWLRAAAERRPFHFVGEPLAVIGLHSGQVTWRDQGLPSRMIETLSAFRFQDRREEHLRLARLSEAFLLRAHVHLRHGRFVEGGQDIARAHRIAAHPPTLRALLALSGLPNMLGRGLVLKPEILSRAVRAWRRIRPPVVARPPRTSPQRCLSAREK